MALGQSIIRRSRLAKLNALAADLALNLAKKNRDPLYFKTRKMKSRWKKLKVMVFKKYGRQALSMARDVANRSGSSSMMISGK